MKKFYALAIVAGLSACQSTTNPAPSGGNNPNPAPAPETKSVTAKHTQENVPDTVQLRYNPTTEKFVSTYTYSDGSSYTYETTMKEFSNGLKYRDSGGNAYMIAGATASGSGAASIGGYYKNSSTLERIGTSELPTTGSARYSANYAASYREGGALQPAITGKVWMDANFEDGEIHGRISDRQQVGTSKRFDNVTLETTSLIDGEFYGQAEGGRVSGAGTNWTDNGEYVGMITGANGEDIIGTVSLNHGTTGEEYGVFVSD